MIYYPVVIKYRITPANPADTEPMTGKGSGNEQNGTETQNGSYAEEACGIRAALADVLQRYSICEGNHHGRAAEPYADTDCEPQCRRGKITDEREDCRRFPLFLCFFRCGEMDEI